MTDIRIHPTLKHPVTGLPLEAVGIVRGRPVWPVLGGAPDDGGGDGGQGGDGGAGDGGNGGQGGDGKVFTQAELNAKIAERLQRERAKFADYDELKAKVAGSQTVEQQLAQVKEELSKTQTEALRRTVQARYGISDEDAELFLVGTDKDTLEKQAQRLKERADEQSKNGGRVPGEGRNGRPTVTDDKQAVRTLFGRS